MAVSFVLGFLRLSRHVCRSGIAWTFVRALESSSHECWKKSVRLHSLVATSSRLCCVLVRSAVCLWFRLDMTPLLPNPGHGPPCSGAWTRHAARRLQCRCFQVCPSDHNAFLLLIFWRTLPLCWFLHPCLLCCNEGNWFLQVFFDDTWRSICDTLPGVPWRT